MKNKIYKVIFTLMIFSAAAEIIFCAPAPAVETVVDRVIEKSQNWTPDKSPYIIRETVTVEKKAVITVYPGTVVLFEKEASLVIKGAFYAKGLPTNPVRFLPRDGEAFYEGIRFESRYTNHIEFAIMVRGAIVVEGSRLLLNNNYILNSTGVELFPFAEVTVKDNYFYNNTYGVYVEGEKTSFAISGNTFMNNRFAVYLKKTFKQLISGNNFEGNNVNLTNYTPDAIEAQNNFWGSADETAVARLIFDKTKNSQVGAVNYRPFAAAQFGCWVPPAAFTALVKLHLSQKKPEADVTRAGFGVGSIALMPISPEYIQKDAGISAGYCAEFNTNITSWLLIGVEGKIGTVANKDKALYDYTLDFTQLLINLYSYIGYKKNVFLLPYAKLGNGIGIVSEKYKYPAGNTLKINDIYYAALAGVGMEWFILRYMSVKADVSYNAIAAKRGMVSWPLISASATIYFDLPLFLSAEARN